MSVDQRPIRLAVVLLGFASSGLLPLKASAEASSETQLVDTIIFGDAASEKSHILRAEGSEIIKGGLDEPARQLLPKEPASFQGGSLTFTIKVDPQKQNYFTIRLWGSDRGADRGRFQVFKDNLQLGYRHEGDHDILNATSNDAWAPGRFVYQTILLPPSLTRGKSEIELTIRSFGPVWNYGETYERFQKFLEKPTRGIYRVYTHSGGRFVPDTSEKQGSTPQATIRQTPGPEVIDESRKIVIDRLTRALADGKSNGRMNLMATAYNVKWTPAYQNPIALEQIINDGDETVRRTAANPKAFDGTWGALGGFGKALPQVWSAIESRMDEKVDLGVEGATTRREAWATMIHKGMVYLRTHRRGFTNQSMIVDMNIYASNRALTLLKPELSIPEEKAMRYMYESVGLEPWLGSNKTDPNNPNTVLDDEFEKPYGANYRTVTLKGTSRELGWVGSYGETILGILHEMIHIGDNSDARLKAQLERIQEARFYFRYPAIDNDGNQIMRLTAEIDNRHTYYPRAGAAYLACEVGESWWLDTPAMFPENKKIVGVAQQMLADNQYFQYIQRRLKDNQTGAMMRNVEDYEKVKGLPPSDYRLPMTDGQPDFVYSDEENGIVVVKHGDTRIFANFYWRAVYGVNGLARLLEVDSVNTKVATVQTEFKIENVAGTYKRPNAIHMMNSSPTSRVPPPPVPTQAWEGHEIPIAAFPADAVGLKAGNWGPFVGKASYYQLRYGKYLFAINTTEDKIYTVAVPSNAPANAVDLVTGNSVKAGQELSLRPLTTAVIYLGK